MAGLAKHIVVDRDDAGIPRITIDGQQLPWYTTAITPAPNLNEMPTITVTIPAEKVTMVNDSELPHRKTGRGEIEPGRWRCGHRGCSGYHSTPDEACC